MRGKMKKKKKKLREFDEDFPGIIRAGAASDFAGPLVDGADRLSEMGVEEIGVIEAALIVVWIDWRGETVEFEAHQTHLADRLNHALNQPRQPDRPSKDPPQLLEPRQRRRILRVVVG